MKKQLAFGFLLVFCWSFAQQLAFQNLLQDQISIRAIQIWNNRVYYAGTDSKFGYVNLQNPKRQKQIQLSDKKLQFRTLAQDRKYFYSINIESPAYFFRIKKTNLKHRIVFEDTLKTAFYDALHFVDKHRAFALSDPDEEGNARILQYHKKEKFFWKNQTNGLAFRKGEAAFAASNSNMASSENYLWIATGGSTSRILRKDFDTNIIWVFPRQPFISGKSSQGIYSIDFYKDLFGVAVGGDYTQQSANINNIATTNNGGESWTIRASGENAGYMTCVKIRPNSKGKDMIAVGDQHISYSADYGKTWTKISDEKGLYTVAWLDKNTLVFAGKNRIVKANFETD